MDIGKRLSQKVGIEYNDFGAIRRKWSFGLDWIVVSFWQEGRKLSSAKVHTGRLQTWVAQA